MEVPPHCAFHCCFIVHRLEYKCRTHLEKSYPLAKEISRIIIGGMNRWLIMLAIAVLEDTQVTMNALGTAREIRDDIATCML